MKKDFRTGGPLDRFTRQMFTRIITALACTLRDEALSIAQVAALHLVEQAGTARVSDLASELTLSASATSRLVDGLVERGFLERAEDPEDRRAKVLKLSAEGQRFVDEISAGRLATIAENVERIPGELLSRVLAAARALGGR